jgi:LmbE family N-acetylglucosaminyl deacetylase
VITLALRRLVNMVETPKRVLVVIPHPDDGEGGCGGTVSRWIKEGAEVVYVMCTNGDKGARDYETTSERLAAIREQEQLDAARVFGVKEVVFLRHPDGGLEDSREFRGQVVREIRRHRPEVMMCLDPFRTRGHSHRDHRVSGQVAIDAACTYAWRPHYFPEHGQKAGLQPHAVKEIYLWGTSEPDTFIDISDTLELKIEGLTKHASQMGDPDRAREWIPHGAQRTGEQAGLPYAEGFRVMRFSPDPLLDG